jgi:hypothetical protein
MIPLKINNYNEMKKKPPLTPPKEGERKKKLTHFVTGNDKLRH